MTSFADARGLAETLLADHFPERWRRTQVVAREALRLAGVPGVDRASLIIAAVLLDVGHSPVAARTGFPPLDAARLLRSRRYERRVVALVAHRTAAAVDAECRGLDLAGLPDEATATRDALWWCDLVADAHVPLVCAGPDDRLDLDRRRATSTRAAVERTRHRLDAAGIPPVGRPGA